MNPTKYIISPAPHLHGHGRTSRIMGDVIVALVPALIFSVIAFGWDALRVTSVSVIACVVFEWAIRKFVLGGRPTVGDLSAVVTGVLLAFNLPASVPTWMVVVGAFVAIGIAKMTFGGLGKNPFNPALVARVFLLVAYPVQMTSFPRPAGELVDVFSGATPLEIMKYRPAGDVEKWIDFQDILFGSIPGSLGEISALLLLAGGVFLLWRRVISWHIPVAVLGTMGIFTYCIGGLAFAQFHLLAGGAVLGAVYMATDYATSPMTRLGKMIYGVGIGFLTVAIRLWGGYPEGMSFAILLMNAATPLIDIAIKPRRFGVNTAARRLWKTLRGGE